MRPLQGYTARVIFAKVLIQDGLEGETFATNMTVKGLVACVLADMILQLSFRVYFLPHMRQTNGVIPMCRRMWRSRLPFWLKDLAQ